MRLAGISVDWEIPEVALMRDAGRSPIKAFGDDAMRHINAIRREIPDKNIRGLGDDS